LLCPTAAVVATVAAASTANVTIIIIFMLPIFQQHTSNSEENHKECLEPQRRLLFM